MPKHLLQASFSLLYSKSLSSPSPHASPLLFSLFFPSPLSLSPHLPPGDVNLVFSPYHLLETQVHQR